MIKLPWPAKILWPNGRGHHMDVWRETRRHREWAFYAAVEYFQTNGMIADAGHYRLNATFHPKTRNAVDADNASASLKAYQDGIASAMGVDDKIFREPKITFGEPVKNGCVIVEIL